MVLEQVNSPEDVKTLDDDQLEQLSKDVRNKIIGTVSKTGGHLAPDLGAVELTIALHRVFDSPKDRIVWDVGHQSYTHKLLTGRKEEFHTLRQMGGIAGYPRIEESEHDHLNVGHSSTSISAALGMATARDLKEEDYHIIPVIGDGAMTAGLAFEGLNQTAYMKKDMIIVLNDNGMSTSPNVGGMSAYTNRMKQKVEEMDIYHQVRSDIHYLWDQLEAEGKEDMVKAVKRLREAALETLTPGMIFEELGLNYIGIVDGHNIDELEEAFRKAKTEEGPVLVHVRTKKGKGYKPSEENPTKFHGTGPFDPETGESKSSRSAKKYSMAFVDSLIDLAKDDEKIVAVTPAMAPGSKLAKFKKIFPGRMIDVGIAEQHAVTFGAGLALNGMKPFVNIYSSFLQRAYDQVLHDVALTSQPVRFLIERSGIVGDDGPTHHGVFDLSYMRTVPNAVVMAPKNEQELANMTKTMYEYEDGPISTRIPRGSGEGVDMDGMETLEIGKGEILRRGEDILLVGIGKTVNCAMEASKILQQKGIEATVFNARFAKPIDEKIAELANEIGNVVTIEDNILEGGFGSGVLELLNGRSSGVKLKRIGHDGFVQHGNASCSCNNSEECPELRKHTGISKGGVAEEAEKLLRNE
ncbi:MAG: 1-deoxy-D-xylulose-5-phosphate synthase [Candidatus Aenigmatarchaeota archaeon]